MRNAKRIIEGEIEVDSESYAWRLHREPQWCTTDGWRGLFVSVTHVDGQREALIEWPMPKNGSQSVPYRQRPKIDWPSLSEGIRTAIEADWEPLSRGKLVPVLMGT